MGLERADVFGGGGVAQLQHPGIAGVSRVDRFRMVALPRERSGKDVEARGYCPRCRNVGDANPAVVCQRGRRKADAKTVTELQRLADTIRRAYEGDAWHGPSLSEVLEGVDAVRASTK